MQLYFTVALCSLLTSVFCPVSLLSVMGVSLHWLPLGAAFFSPLGLILFTDLSNLTIFNCNHLSYLSPSNTNFSSFGHCSIFNCGTCNVIGHLKLPSLSASYHTWRKTGKQRGSGNYPHTSAGSPWAQELSSGFSLQRELSGRISTVSSHTAFQVKTTSWHYHLWLLRVHPGALLRAFWSW